MQKIKLKPFIVRLAPQQEVKAIKHAIARDITVDKLIGRLIDELPELGD